MRVHYIKEKRQMQKDDNVKRAKLAEIEEQKKEYEERLNTFFGKKLTRKDRREIEDIKYALEAF